MKRSILAASEDKPEIEVAMSQLKDDFDYVMSGLDKLSRSGTQGQSEALTIADSLQSSIESSITSISEIFVD